MIPRIFLGLSAQARLGGVARLARLARSTTISQPATLTHTRTYAQPPNTTAVESMSTHTFHQLSDKVFDSLVETLEAEIEGGGFDVAQSSEVELNVCRLCFISLISLKSFTVRRINPLT